MSSCASARTRRPSRITSRCATRARRSAAASMKANGSLWGCAVVYPAESICLAVGVVLQRAHLPGHGQLGPMRRAGAAADAARRRRSRCGRCGRDPASSVAMDSSPAPRCRTAAPTGRVRGPPRAGTRVRVRAGGAVDADHANDGGDRCSKLPALRAKVPFTDLALAAPLAPAVPPWHRRLQRAHIGDAAALTGAGAGRASGRPFGLLADLGPRDVGQRAPPGRRSR